MERVVGKAAGGRGQFYTCMRVELAHATGADARPDAAGGEEGHGAAKPEAVIHRLHF